MREETRQRAFTAAEKSRIEAELRQQLGPEFITSRPGDRGRPTPYLEGHRVIQLANEIFGFDGWSSEIRDRKVEFQRTENGKASIAISCHMRVTLRDGTYREDFGFGQNIGRSYPQVYDTALKSAVTDSVKRALRQFGPVLGGCVYEKDYLKSIQLVNPLKREFDVDNLRRPQASAKKQAVAHKSPVPSAAAPAPGHLANIDVETILESDDHVNLAADRAAEGLMSSDSDADLDFDEYSERIATSAAVGPAGLAGPAGPGGPTSGVPGVGFVRGDCAEELQQGKEIPSSGKFDPSFRSQAKSTLPQDKSQRTPARAPRTPAHMVRGSPR